MGTQKIQGEFQGEERRTFMRALLRDLRAMEAMLDDGKIEEGVRRVGAEQEMFLLDRGGHAAPAALDVLKRVDDPHFTTELGLFNLEMNLDPLPFGGDCLSRMESQLNSLLTHLRTSIQDLGVEALLTGILPTIRKSDLGLENMVPLPRYQALNEAMSRLRGGAYQFYIKGLDEILVKHDSVMVESCNASFQVHFQVGAGEFANMYNIAQAVAGPLLACCTNSPVLFGRRLWAETRIALFQQAVDTRAVSEYMRESSPRVTFGNDWVKSSVLELYKEDISRFRTLVGTDLDEDPFEVLAAGKAPQLKALRLHNGTVYRWNRACYGILDGNPHLRIENRVMPSGPSVADEVANAALWFGLMNGLAKEEEDITRSMQFEHAKMNFLLAAREGLGAHLTWLHGEEMSAPRLILDRLLPLAEKGLTQAGVDDKDRDRYLGLIAQRVGSGRTGSRWILQSLASMREQGTPGERLGAVTSAMLARQRSAKPVAEWDLAELGEGGGWKHNYLKVEQYMTTDLFTVHEDDSVDLVANLMEWQRIRHVPVEDSQHQLVGLISYRAILRLIARGSERGRDGLCAADIMKRDPAIIGPDMSTLRAIEVMRRLGVGCLPVVHQGKLIGIITEHDFMDIAAELLELKLKE